MGRARRRAYLGRPSAADRSRHLRRAARGIAHGALLPADALLRHPCGRGSRAGWWAAAAVASCAAGMATKEIDGDGARHGRRCGTGCSAPGPRVSPPGCGGGSIGSLAATLGPAGVPGVAAVPRAIRQSGTGDDLAVPARTQAEVIVHYLRLAFFPSPLVFLYDWPLTPAPLWMAWQAALLAALVALTVAGIVKRHPASFLGAWFFLILAPSSSVLPIVSEVAAEHRMYLPLAAVIAAVGHGRVSGWHAVDGPWTRAARAPRRLRCSIAAGALRPRDARPEPRVLERRGLWAGHGRETAGRPASAGRLRRGAGQRQPPRRGGGAVRSGHRARAAETAWHA